MENETIPINARDNIVTSDYHYFYDEENDSKLWIISLLPGFNGWFNSKIVTVKNPEGTKYFYIDYDYDEEYYRLSGNYTGITSIYNHLFEQDNLIFHHDDYIYGTYPEPIEVNVMIAPGTGNSPFINWCAYLDELCSHLGSPANTSTIGYLMVVPPDQGGGGGSTGSAGVVNQLTNMLSLTSSQKNWLNQNLKRAYQIFYYLVNSSEQTKSSIALEHLDEMINNPSYLDLILSHAETGNGFDMWWEDDEWLDDPANFSLDVDGIGAQYGRLTAAEKALIAQYRIQAATIFMNRFTAENKTIEKMGWNGLNDKTDAFRHAFFQAINTMSVGPTLTQLFADAHESEVPQALSMEKAMDDFNNSVGITIGQNAPFWTSVNTLANMVKTQLELGQLIYIDPLNHIISKAYDVNPHDGIQDCSTCKNGIYDDSTLKPTNQ